MFKRKAHHVYNENKPRKYNFIPDTIYDNGVFIAKSASSLSREFDTKYSAWCKKKGEKEINW